MSTPRPVAEDSTLILRIGNQTSFAAQVFLAPFHYAIANGFESFEWFPDRKPSGAGWDEAALTAAQRIELREAAKCAGLRTSVHARWTANPLVPEGRAALQLDLDLAASLGASLLNVHLYTEAGVEAYVRALVPLLDAAAGRGIQVAIENTVETPPQVFHELFQRLRGATADGIRNAGMCLDIGHANLCAATRNNYLAFLDQLGPDVPIIHLHLHENWGDVDTHLPLFTGPAGANPSGIAGLLLRLESRGYSGSAILEQWPEPPTLLRAARDRLKFMIRELHLESRPGVALPKMLAG